MIRLLVFLVSLGARVLFNRDAIFSPAVVRFVKAMGTKPRRISYRSPWQKSDGRALDWQLSPRVAGARGRR